MKSYSDYYETNLYPFQTGVLNTVKKCNTRFYLTGGTALSRGYFEHRYSDDLDFFVNNDESFHEQVALILSQLKEEGYKWDSEKDFFKADTFYSLKLHEQKLMLKVDFVNDVPVHFGKLKESKILFRIDSIENILSNKVTALFRYAGKDVADIHEIALHNKFNWTNIILEARQKENGIEIPEVAEILQAMPENEFTNIRWKKKIEWRQFKKDIDIIVKDLITGRDNSLYK